MTDCASWSRTFCEEECMVDPEYGRERADTARVATEIGRALLEKRPLSLISLCDGESATLWAGKGFQQFHYLAGFGIPGEEFVETAEQLAAAIAKTDIVCVPRDTKLGGRNIYGPKVRESLRLWGIELKSEALVGDAMVCWYLLYDMWLVGLLEGQRVLVINNEAVNVCTALEAKTVPGPLADQWPADWIRTGGTTPVMLGEGMAGSQRAIDEALAVDPKPTICLIGGGARTAHIATTVAEALRIPVIELGAAITWLWQPVGQVDFLKMHDLYQREG
jgi:hypothetical protein